jgi:Protein of unknown function (DUF1353)
MLAAVLERPTTFDRVDLVKAALGDEPVPGDEKLWILGGDLIFEVDAATRCVPRGFTTDGGSVPPLVRRACGWTPFAPPERWPVVAHDWLYAHRGISRVWADAVLAALLASEGADWWSAAVIHRGVRLLGGATHAAHAEAGPMIHAGEVGSR